MKVCLFLLALLVLLPSAEALHLSTGNLDLPGSPLVEKAEVIFQHRFYGNASDSDNLFGMDLGANVALGFGARLNDRIDLTLLRASFDKEYYIAGKIALADGVSILLGSATKSTLVGQLILTKGLSNNRVNLSLIPSFANPRQDNPTFALGLAGGLSFDQSIGYLENIEIIGEYIPVIAGYARKYPTASAGVKIQTWGHFFTVVLTNSSQILPGGFLAGSPDNSYRLGFTIIRKF